MFRFLENLKANFATAKNYPGLIGQWNKGFKF